MVFCGSVQQAPVGGAPVWYMADACGGQACGAVGDTRMCVFVGVLCPGYFMQGVAGCAYTHGLWPAQLEVYRSTCGLL